MPYETGREGRILGGEVTYRSVLAALGEIFVKDVASV
jgi:hypothetical protein